MCLFTYEHWSSSRDGYSVALLSTYLQGVMMTHGNIVATAAAVMTLIPHMGTKDVYLAYLPLAHVFELAAEVTC